MVFEATVGVLTLAVGRWTQLGYLGVIRVLPRAVAVRVDRDVGLIMLLPMLCSCELSGAPPPAPHRPATSGRSLPADVRS